MTYVARNVTVWAVKGQFYKFFMCDNSKGGLALQCCTHSQLIEDEFSLFRTGIFFEISVNNAF